MKLRSCPQTAALSTAAPSARRRRRVRAGFTLLEVLLVVGILVALAALVVPNLIGSQEQAQVGNAQIQVMALNNAVKEYKITTKQWPPNLEALVTAPSPQPQGWRPFLEKPDFNDPWGNPISYQVQGTRNNLGNPDIWSNGPNGVSGDTDDIGNWGVVK